MQLRRTFEAENSALSEGALRFLSLTSKRSLPIDEHEGGVDEATPLSRDRSFGVRPRSWTLEGELADDG